MNWLIGIGASFCRRSHVSLHVSELGSVALGSSVMVTERPYQYGVTECDSVVK